jgi:ComF family protein
MFRDLLSLVFSSGCVACGVELTSQEEWVCFHCLSEIEQTNFHLSPSMNELYYRFGGKVPLRGAASLFYFDKKGYLQDILRALKYGDQPQIGVFLGELYGEVLAGSEFVREASCLIPVPLHASRFRKRGYNQSEKIAAGLSRQLGIPVETGLLRRQRRTLTQTRKSRFSRWTNVSDAFVADGIPACGAILVDDVITTGSTLEACIRALLEAGMEGSGLSVMSIGMAR